MGGNVQGVKSLKKVHQLSVHLREGLSHSRVRIFLFSSRIILYSLISSDVDLKTSFFLWIILALLGVTLFYDRKYYFKQRMFTLALLVIVRGLITLGVQPTLTLMGLTQVRRGFIGRGGFSPSLGSLGGGGLSSQFITKAVQI